MIESPTCCPQGADRGRWWMPLLVAGVTLLVFAPVLKHEFLFWDDNVFLLRNPELNPPTAAALAKFWGHPLAGYKQFYVPVTYTVWWVVAHFGRETSSDGNGSVLAAGAFHAANLGFHVVAAVLTFLILRGLVHRDWPAALGAMVFALHPLQADPVSWAANMYTPLSGMLALAAALLYLYFSDSDPAETPSRRRLLFATATLCFGLAILSKPVVVLLPLIVVAIELLLRGRSLRQCAPLVLWLAIGAVAAAMTRHIHTGSAAFAPAIWMRPFIATDAVAFYLSKLVLPLRLIPDYGRSPRWAVGHVWMWITWILPALVAVVAWRLRRAAPWGICGLIVFVLAMFPTLGLAPFDYQFYSTAADRYAYLSLFGVALIIAFGTERLSTSRWMARRRTVAIGGCTAAILVMAALTRQQIGYWQDTGTLFARTLDVNPKSLAAHLQLGYMLINRAGPDQMDEALAHFRAAAELDPDDPGLLYNTAIAHLRKGDVAAAVPLLRRAADLKPAEPAIPYTLGRALLAGNDRNGAAGTFRKLCRQFPGYADADRQLALLESTRQSPQATTDLRP